MPLQNCIAVYHDSETPWKWTGSYLQKVWPLLESIFTLTLNSFSWFSGMEGEDAGFKTCKLHLKDDLECFAIYWAIAYNICTPPPSPGCEDVPFLLTPETPEDWIKLHLPLKTFIKHWSLPWNMGLPLKNMVLPLKNFMKIKASPQRIAFVYSTSVKESSSYFYCIPLKEFHCPQLGGGTDIKI